MALPEQKNCDSDQKKRHFLAKKQKNCDSDQNFSESVVTIAKNLLFRFVSAFPGCPLFLVLLELVGALRHAGKMEDWAIHLLDEQRAVL